MDPQRQVDFGAREDSTQAAMMACGRFKGVSAGFPWLFLGLREETVVR